MAVLKNARVGRCRGRPLGRPGWAVALGAAVMLSAGCAGPDVRGPFRNQYVDEETGKPIEGVVFLAVWHDTVVTPVHGTTRYYDAQEDVSGADGRVEIEGLAAPVWRLGVGVTFYEFAPGGYWYASRGTQVTPPDGQVYIDSTVTFMRRLKTAEERIKRIPSLPSVPDEKMRHFIAALDQERASLGLPQYYPEGRRP